MKLYLIANDFTIVNRWRKALIDFLPECLVEIDAELETPSIVMVLDKTIAALNDDALMKIFQHRVMIFSMTPNFKEAQRLLVLGAMGYGNAMMHESHLHSVYHALLEGKIWLHPDFITMMISQIRDMDKVHEKSQALLETLSKREQEVAVMLGNGSTHQEIADELEITVRTVKAHATAIYQKLDVKDRLALSLFLHT